MQPESPATPDTSAAAPAPSSAAPAAAAPEMDATQAAFANFFASKETTGDSPAQPEGTPAAAAAASASPSAAPATPAAAASAAAASAAPATGAAAEPPANPFASLGEGFTDEASVKAVLAQLPQLRENQLTDEHRQLIALASDPEKLSRYATLSSVDYTKMDDKSVLFEEFKQQNPGLSARVLKSDFEAAFADKYKALAYEDPADEDYQIAKERLESRAGQARTALETSRTTELGALKPAIDNTAAEARAAENQKHLDAHVARVAELVKDFKGLPFATAKGSEPFVVTPSDPAAYQEALTNPMRYILSQVTAEDGSIDYAAQQEIALALVERKNMVGYGVNHAKNLAPAVSVAEQANIQDPPVPQTPKGDEWKTEFVRMANGN